MVDKYKVIFSATLDTSQLDKQASKVSKKKINIGAKEAKKDVDSLVGSMGNAIKKTVEWTIATGAIFGALQQIREGVSYIKELDKEMTNIRVVTGATKDEVSALAVEFNNIAKEMGATTIEVAQGSLEWFRQGKTAEEAQSLIRASLVASKLANMESAQATEYLTSILNGFKLEASDATWVLDKLIAVDNESATSMAELAEALKRSANSAQQAGVDFDTLVAYIATVSSVTRKSAGSIGESFKTLFARLQNLKLNKLDEMGESASDVEKVLQRFTTTTLFDSANQFRDMDVVLEELASQWGDLQQTEKSAIAIAVAGVRQRENFLVLMENFNDVLGYQEIQANSAGQAMERYDLYLQSVEAHANQLKASWEEMWATTMNSDVIIYFIDVAKSVTEFITKMGGLQALLPTIIGLFVMLKGEAIALSVAMGANAIVSFVRNFSALASLLPIIVKQYHLYNTVSQASIVATGGLTGAFGFLGIAVGVVVWRLQELKKVSEGLQEDIADGIDYVDEKYKEMLKKSVSGVDGTNVDKQNKIFEQTRAGIDIISDGYEALSWKQKLFIDKNELLDNAMIASSKALYEQSDTVEEYKQNLQKLADEYGYVVDENLQLVRVERQGMYSKKETVLETVKLQEAVAQANEKQKEYTNTLNNQLDAMGKIKDETVTLSDAMSGLHQEMQQSLNIAKNSMEGAFSIDDMLQLSGIYENWTELLTIEGDIIKLNADEMMRLNLEKARTLKFQGMLTGDFGEEEIAFLNAYISQLERSMPMTRDYAQFLQDVALQASGLTGSLGGFSEAIGEISRQFEEGELSATQYFDALQRQLSEADFGDLVGEQQQLLFAGLVSDASSSLAQISSMFDAGEMDILSYSEQLIGVMGVFQQLGSVADASGIEVSDSLDQMSNATIQLGELQKLNFEIAKVVQLQATENLRIGTQEFQAYAQNMAQLAFDAGVQVQDLQGNVFSSASQIATWMMQSQENFNSFTQQTAGATGNAISALVMSAGDLLVTLGDAIGQFDAQINFQPVWTGGMTNFPIDAGGLFQTYIGIPTFQLDISGSSTSMQSIGNAISQFGASLQGMASNISLTNDIYQLTKPLNQITGTGEKVTDVYDDLEKAIGGATDKTKELTNAVEEMRKKQIQALQDQLDSYNKIINKRKQLLDTMVQEKRYQDELQDRQKSIADIQKEILELSMDSSEEAKRKRLELESQLSEQQKELDTFQFEHSVDKQQAMLEEERQRFEDQISGAIKVIENIEADNVKQFIKKLRDALGYIPTEQSVPVPTGAIQGADAMIANQALSTAMSGSSISGSFTSIGDSLSNLGIGTTPQIVTKEVNFSVEKLMEINVAGNLDESVVPDIEKISQQVIDKINEIMNLRGFTRSAGSYSI